ncbi:unnamed protein product [Paramecium primaurelia]|uniref:Uncharacterized protein n=1 Tax=Paramecium primaurelia TaxID=5886 RepID=A0A8S1PR27_PARPR|nr:unnamed protein product [Paramecium primaurelia]
MSSDNLRKGLINDSFGDFGSFVETLIPEEKKTAREKAGFLGKLFVSWIYPTLKLAQKQPLEVETIQPLSKTEKSSYIYEKFKNQLIITQKGENTLFKALFRTFQKQIIITFIWLVISVVTSVVIPIMIKSIIDYITNQVEDYIYASTIIAVIIISRAINMISNAQARLEIRSFGFDAQSVLSVELMSKSLRTSFLSNPRYTTGEVINLMQVDAGKLQFVTYYLGVALLVPIQLILTVYLMFVYIGLSFLGGFGIMILTAVWNTLIGKFLMKYQQTMMKEKDKRTNCANQIFSQIKFIKINAFEDFFRNKLFKLRKAEIDITRKRYFGTAFYIFSVWLSPLLILSGTFLMHILLGHQLSAGSTFAIISLFQMLQQPLLQLPIAINEVMATNISLKRIQKFLFTDELQSDCIQFDYYGDEKSVEIKDGNFYWSALKKEEIDEQEKKEQENKKKKKQKKNKNKKLQVEEQIQKENEKKQVLYNINMEIKKGKMVGIIGDVGSGKTSILQAIIGEMLYNPENPPKVTITGSLAYVGQKYWIQNLTVKENILFGLEYKEQKYQNALKYSCLQQDLKILIKGDETMIGEKGINLSGGQKARISLARAIYSDADIILLDDPISAVDAHVGNFIMNECLNGYLKDKTRILITHALNNLQYVDYVYLFENGSIIEQGTFQEIQQSSNFNSIFQKLYKHQNHNEEEETIEQKVEELPQLAKQASQKEESKNDQNNELMLDEDRERGNLALETYKQYFKLTGYFNICLLVFIQICWIGCYFGTSILIALWTSHAEEDEHIDNYKYLEVYFYFSLGQGIFAFLRPLLLVSAGTRTSDKIHTRMINCLLYAPQCSFFERVPLGRILNRLTKDQNSLDSEVYWGLSWFFVSMSLLIANLTIYVYSSTAYMLIPLFFYFCLCWWIQQLYVTASRELQRLESISKSPIVSFFGECINGQSYVRVFKKESKFIEKHCDNMDVNRRVFLELIGSQTWFMLVLGLVSLIVNAMAIVYCVFYSFSNPSLAGLLLTYATQIDGNVSECVQSFSQLQLGLVSFERCLAFTKIEPEPGYKELVDNHLVEVSHQENYLDHWPKEGRIDYINYSVRYREGLKPALKNLNITIDPQDKIGVVGRTGAGKSTMTLTLLRILEALEGKIIIDDVDISTISLKQLREHITMIMQDSTIFDGTLRENIDPLNQRTDEEIIKVLEQCCLKELTQQRNGLNTQISEGGDNLSSGEKQLICIARAVLKKSKVVLIDEATANIDVETEHKIQETILNAFSDCTVITIAHRINTILHCDKIIVIDQGEIKEYGKTQDLLLVKDSIFYGIYQEALKHNKK